MAQATIHNGYLVYDSLDACSQFEKACAVGYRILGQDNADDRWTNRFYSFKNGDRLAIRFAKQVMPRMARRFLADNHVSASTVTFVPALRSREAKADKDGSLSKIARLCAKKCGAQFDRKLLRKKPHADLRSSGIVERKRILDKAEYRSNRTDTSVVVVVDDFLTTGLTLCAIIEALKSARSDVRVYGLALAKNEYAYRVISSVSTPNDHIHPGWMKRWGH